MSNTLVAEAVPMEVKVQRMKIDRSRGPAFEVKKWQAVALWGWDIVVDNCAICRNHIMDGCIGCQADEKHQDSEDCVIAWGVCNILKTLNSMDSIITACLDGSRRETLVLYVIGSGNSKGSVTSGLTSGGGSLSKS